jgi:dTDP-4-amino-4,6-dideoxygalactose transaminase
MRPRFLINLSFYELLKTIFSQENVSTFEKKFSNYFKLKFPLSFSYGRSAIFCFFKALNIKNKDIIMPSYTCSVVAHAIVKSGNKPVFLDVNLNNFNFNNEDLHKKINKKTACIILTNTFGFAQNAKEVIEIIKFYEKKFKTKIYLIQDCCHSFDAKFKNEVITKYGDMILFSFNISKTITSIFGAIATFNDKKIFDRVKYYRNKKFVKKSFFAIFKRFVYIFLAVIFFNKFFYFIVYFLQKKTKLLLNLTDEHHLDQKISFPKDYKTLMSDLEAKVGLSQLAKYKKIRRNKIKNSKFYSEVLEKNINIKLPKFSPNNTYSHFPVIVKNKNKTLNKFKNFGIELGEVIQYSIPELKPYKSNKKFLNSNFLSKHVVNIPNEYKIKKEYLKLL